MRLPRHVMSIGDVADLLGVCAERVRQLDDELMPVRGRAGYRRYDPIVVERVARRRAARAA